MQDLVITDQSARNQIINECFRSLYSKSLGGIILKHKERIRL